MTSKQAMDALARMDVAPGWTLQSIEDPTRCCTIFSLTDRDGRNARLSITDEDIRDARSSAAIASRVLDWVEDTVQSAMGLKPIMGGHEHAFAADADYVYGGGGGGGGGHVVGGSVVNEWGGGGGGNSTYVGGGNGGGYSAGGGVGGGVIGKLDGVIGVDVSHVVTQLEQAGLAFSDLGIAAAQAASGIDGIGPGLAALGGLDALGKVVSKLTPTTYRAKLTHIKKPEPLVPAVPGQRRIDLDD